ncbi:MAG: hypothetical protein WCI73_16320, partial [Phycisphaerae bacterium]
EPARQWCDVYQKIQRAGKAMQILAVDIPDALAIMEALRPEGAWLCVGGSYSAEEVAGFLKKVEAWRG